MAADLPPVPNCIEQVTELKSQSLIFTGQADAIRRWIGSTAVKEGPFEVSLSQVDNDGNQTAVLRFPAETPYRTIGSVIYSAQVGKMVVGAWTFQPPFCRENGMPH